MTSIIASWRHRAARVGRVSALTAAALVAGAAVGAEPATVEAGYESAFADYRGYVADAELQSWREANAFVGTGGGHGSHGGRSDDAGDGRHAEAGAEVAAPPTSAAHVEHATHAPDVENAGTGDSAGAAEASPRSAAHDRHDGSPGTPAPLPEAGHGAPASSAPHVHSHRQHSEGGRP